MTLITKEIDEKDKIIEWEKCFDILRRKVYNIETETDYEGNIYTGNIGSYYSKNIDEFEKLSYREKKIEFLIRVELYYKEGQFLDYTVARCSEYNNCPGWDGISNRCHCGANELYWELDDGLEFIYPEK